MLRFLSYFKIEAGGEFQQIYIDNFICERVLLEKVEFERAMIPEILGYYERPLSPYTEPATAHSMKMTVSESSLDKVQGDFLFLSGVFIGKSKTTSNINLSETAGSG